MLDQFGILEFIKREQQVGVGIERLVRQRSESFDHLPGEIRPQRIADRHDLVQERRDHRTCRRAVGQRMRGRLGRENAAVEIGRKRAVMRAELHLVGKQRSEGHRPQRPGSAGHRDDLVFVRAAAPCIDILPEELLNGVVGRGPARGRLLPVESCHGRQAGFGARPDIDAIDGKAETVLQFAAEGPGNHGHVVVGKSYRLHDAFPVRSDKGSEPVRMPARRRPVMKYLSSQPAT